MKVIELWCHWPLLTFHQLLAFTSNHRDNDLNGGEPLTRLPVIARKGSCRDCRLVDRKLWGALTPSWEPAICQRNTTCLAENKAEQH